MDREKIIEELEEHINGHCSSDLKRICHVSLMENVLALLKEQEELIKAMKRDLDLVRSCKVCGNWTKCTPDASPESEEFKIWRDCGGSCKLNWKWRGI